MHPSRSRFLAGASTIALAFASLSCSDRTVLAPDGKSVAQQASHNSAPGAFTWLSPLGTGVADPATFDATGATRVVVCTWTAGVCSGAPVAQFATRPSTGVGALTANTTVGAFEAAWSLLSTSYTTRRTYRITAYQGSIEIGAVLVDVVRGRWGFVNTPLIAANELSIRFHVARPPAVLTTIAVAIAPSQIVIGQTATVTAQGFDQYGAPIPTGGVAWTSSDNAVATVTASGVVTGVAPSSAAIKATVGSVVGQQMVTATAPPAIKVNEVESNGGTPGDWIELYNSTNAPVDISNWLVRDNDVTHGYRLPAGTIIPAGGYYVVEEAAMDFGLGAADDARLYHQFGALVDSYTWTAHAATTYGRCPNGTGAFATSASSTKGAPNNCGTVGTTVKINEVESNEGSPGDWIELVNTGATAVNLSGYQLRDNDNTHIMTFGAGTTIAAGAFLAVDETALGFGLGAADAARLFNNAGTLIDSYEWTGHASTTYGRCPDGTGAFVTTFGASRGTANVCAPATSPWPGSDDVHTVDVNGFFGGNMSGLVFETGLEGAASVLWAVKNGPGTMYRLIQSGSQWIADPSSGWGAGKTLRYNNGTGNPDAEGVTYAAGGSTAGMYVSTERNNDISGTSRNVILRFDPNQAGTTLSATHEWNITSDLPSVGANLGIEAITWIPDAFLTGLHFFDESKNHTYNPAEYADHGTGLFFVGVEANGIIYAYALNHANSTFTRVATITTGFPGVMDLSFDRETGYLWAICDDGCQNTSGILEINTTTGKFGAPRRFARPSTLPATMNNEGFALASQAECVGGRKPVFWSDDSATGGHAIRSASLPCGAFAASLRRR